VEFALLQLHSAMQLTSNFVEPRTSGRSVDAGRNQGSVTDGSYQSLSAVRARPCCSISSAHRCCYRSTGQTDGHPTVKWTFTAYGKRIIMLCCVMLSMLSMPSVL